MFEEKYGIEFEEFKSKEFWYWHDQIIYEDTFILLNDFCSFLKVLFNELRLPTPTKLQLDFARELQFGSNRSIKMCYRGFGKSWIICIYVLWLLYRNPNTKTLIISVAEDKAAENSMFIQNLLYTVDFLQFLNPKTSKNSKITKKSSSLAFDVAHCKIEQAPSVKAVGITGRITGSRADVIIFDDVESIENSSSHKKRQYVLHKCMVEGESILKDNENSKIYYIGTPQTFQSIYFKIIGFDIKIWPLRYPNREQYNKYFVNYLNKTMYEELNQYPELFDSVYGYQNNKGRIADPSRFSEEAASDKEFRQGGSNFDLQYMLYTHSSDSNKFRLKLKDLIVDDIDLNRAAGYYTWSNSNECILEELPVNSLTDDCFYSPIKKDEKYYDFETTRMYIDVSGTGSDEMSYVVLKMLHGLIFLVDVGGVKNYEEENLKKLANVAKKYKVDDVLTEDNFGDGLFRKVFEPVLNKIYPTTLKGFKVGNKFSKEKRISDILLPLFESHRIVVDKNAILKDTINLPDIDSPDIQIQYSLFYQIPRLTETKGCLFKDDRIDIFASGCKDLIDYLDRDAVDMSNQKKLTVKDIMNSIIFEDEDLNGLNGYNWINN